MSKVSKTARASMAQTVGEKKVIPDDVYIKNLRYDVNNNIHATQEGAKALLRAYDSLLKVNDELVAIKTANAELRGELLKASDVITELNKEIAAAQAIFGNAAKSTEYSTLESLEAEAKNNHD